MLALTGAAGAVFADAEHSLGLRQGMTGEMGGGGMMRSMRAMMQGCGAMMQDGSPRGRPNEQWRENRRSTPDRRE
jgi:hypothetical protein